MSILVIANDPIPLNLVIEDGNPNKFVRASLYDNAKNLLGEVPLTHTSNGLYRDDSVVASPILKRVFAVYEIFNDVSYTQICTDYDLRSEDVFDIDISSSVSETNFVVSVPDKIELPYSGFKTYRLVIYLFDWKKEPIDPTDSEVFVHIEDINNGEVLPLTACVREQVGVYFYRYTVSSAMDEQPIWVEFSFARGGIPFLVGEVSELIKTNSRTISLDQYKLTNTRAKNLDNLDVTVSSGQSASDALVQFNTTQTVLSNVRNDIAAVKSDVLTVDSIVDTIKLSTDKIGNPVHGTLAQDNSNLEGIELQTQGKVDSYYSLLDKHLLSQDLVLSTIEMDTSLIGAPIHGSLAMDMVSLGNDILAVNNQVIVSQGLTNNVLTKIGTPAYGTVSADIAKIFADTQELTNILYQDRVEKLDFLDLPLSTLETNLIALDRYNSLFAAIQAVQGAVGAIPNNTTFVGIVPPILVLPLPTEVSKTYKFYVNLFDQQGLPQDADANITYRIETVTGDIIVANTNMFRENVGQYWCQYEVLFGDSERPLFVIFEYAKNAFNYKQVRITEVHEFESKLDTLVSRLTQQRAQNLDKLDVNVSSRLSYTDSVVQQNALLVQFSNVLTAEQNIANLLGVPSVSIANELNIIKAYAEKIGTPIGTLASMLLEVLGNTSKIGVPFSGSLAQETSIIKSKIDAIPNYTATLADIQNKVNLIREKIGYSKAQTIEDLIVPCDLSDVTAALGALALDVDSLLLQSLALDSQSDSILAGVSQIKASVDLVDSHVLGLVTDVSGVSVYVDNLPMIESKIDSLNVKSGDILTGIDSIEISLGSIPKDTLLSTDPRLDYLDAPISSRATPADCGNGFVGDVTFGSTDLLGIVDEEEVVLGMVRDDLLVGVLEDSQ